MMKMKNVTNHNGGSVPEPRGLEWEMRPGGLLVQRRTLDSDRDSVPPPTIRVKVKFGSTYHEVNISSQATFGTCYTPFFFFLLLFYYSLATFYKKQIYFLNSLDD